MKVQSSILTLWFATAAFIALLGIGWIWNIAKIVQSGFDVINGMFIARCVGVFIAPLGGVLGYL